MALILRGHILHYIYDTLAEVPAGLEEGSIVYCEDIKNKLTVINGALIPDFFSLPVSYGFNGDFSTLSTSFVEVPFNLNIGPTSSYAQNRTQIFARIIADVNCSQAGVTGEMDFTTITAGPQLLSPVTIFTNTTFAMIQSAEMQLLPNKTYRIRIRKTAFGAGSVLIRSAILLLTFK